MTSQHITHLPSVALPRRRRMELITMTTNGNDPLVDLWAEQNRLVALCCDADIDGELDALGDKLSAIEHQIANTEARTLAGVLVQAKLHGDVLKVSGKWIHTPALTRNVCTALERMGGAAIVGT